MTTMDLVEDYDEDMMGYRDNKGIGPDIIDSMKPAFYFNTKQGDSEMEAQRQFSDSKKESMTPCFINTPSSSSQFGSLNGTGTIDHEILA